MRSRSKRFVPDERCLGGAHEIETEYRNMQKKIYEAKPQVSQYSGYCSTVTQQRRPGTAGSAKSRQSPGGTSSLGMAERLSLNRARRRANTDMTLPNHYNNLYHLQRRIVEQDSETERKKNPYDVDLYPVHRVPGKKSAVCQYLSSWVPANDRTSSRPTSAPARGHQELDDGPHRAGTRAYSRCKEEENASIEDCGQGTYQEFRDAMLKDIINGRMYEEDKIRRLFRKYLGSNDVKYHRAILLAIDDLRRELDVSL